MGETTTSLRRKLSGASDLKSVVRSMKAVAASSIGQYEQAVRSLTEYMRVVESGLSACLRANGPVPPTPVPGGGRSTGEIGAVVFGSDQGLVGQFNDHVADFAAGALAAMTRRPVVWAVGERVQSRLADAGLPLAGTFPVPASVKAIVPLVGRIIVESEARRGRGEFAELHLFHNRPVTGAVCAPVGQRLLPLDEDWRHAMAERRWPTKSLPEVMGDPIATLREFIRAYLFVSLFRASAESLASENACRLSAMQRAERNIDELLSHLTGTYHRLRQGGIDEELFDVISGFESSGGEDS
ncbi:MAG: F0F1 ATP synthase subunit gamma [Planctomycetes bacterium]|jgi:F-type H+-transporting ATPase subunit gamma|nr:F0F1 ATP synthase subunit gamma [Planctomycetota bacterium]